MKKKSINKDKEISNNDLARMIAQGFARVDERFEKIDQRFEKIDQRFENIEEQLGDMQEDIGKIKDDIRFLSRRFVEQSEFDEFKIRFTKLEKKVNTR